MKMGHCGGQPEAQEGVEEVRGRHRRVLQRLALAADSLADGSWREVVEVGDELIRVLDLDSVAVENLLREILDVVRHDNPGLESYRCCKDVAVIRVRQAQGLNDLFESGHQTIRNTAIHEFPCSLEALPRQIRAPRQKRSNPLLVDAIRPTSSEEIRQGETKQQISERGWVENASVEDGDE